MSVQIHEQADSNIIEVRARGRLTHHDYAQLVPRTKELIHRHGAIRILFEMSDFHGWSVGAMWDDIKFDLEHFKDIERVALAGDKSWEKWMTTFCRPFTKAQVRYFDRGQLLEARQWLASATQAQSA